MIAEFITPCPAVEEAESGLPCPNELAEAGTTGASMTLRAQTGIKVGVIRVSPRGSSRHAAIVARMRR